MAISWCVLCIMQILKYLHWTSFGSFMAIIRSREQFKRYILEHLGEPLVKVNITDSQLESCIDDALQYWSEYHFEGSMRTYLKQIITPSILKITDPSARFIGGEQIVGITSGATARVCSNSHGDRRTESVGGNICCAGIRERDFIAGEQVTIGGKQYTLQSGPDYQTKGIVDEQRIKMPEWILGVVRIIPFSQAMSSQNLFDLQYQIRLNDFQNLTSQSLIYYEQAMEHISLLNWELTAKPNFEFNQYEGYVYPQCNWEYDIDVGDYIIFDCYRALDPKTATRMWMEPWFKQYSVALAKKQYAQNLKKYQGVQLPGGITLNGSEMYQEAIQEIDKLEQQLQSLYPVGCFQIG